MPAPLRFQMLLLLMSLLLPLALAGCGEQPERLENGAPAPAFTLETLGGSALRFPDDVRGEIVALRFWADWCPFCASEMRDIEPVYQRLREQGLRVLAVNVRQDAATAGRFIERLGVTYEVLLDQEGSLARQYAVSGLPTTFFIDREGRIVTRLLGETAPGVFDAILHDLF